MQEPKRVIRTWKDVQPGDWVWSEYFDQWIEVAKVERNRKWWFHGGYRYTPTRAHTKLSWFVKRGLVQKEKPS